MPPASNTAVEFYFTSTEYQPTVMLAYYLSSLDKQYYYEVQIHSGARKIKWRKSAYEYVEQTVGTELSRICFRLGYVRLGLDITRARYRYVMVNSKIYYPPDPTVIPDTVAGYNTVDVKVGFEGYFQYLMFTPFYIAVLINDV